MFIIFNLNEIFNLIRARDSLESEFLVRKTEEEEIYVQKFFRNE